MNFSFQRTYRGRVNAVIIDWAGSTVDYGCCAPAKVFLKIFNDKDIPITIEEARMFMGMHKREHICALLNLPRVNEQWRSIYGAPPNERDVDAMFEKFMPLQLETLKDHSRLIPNTLNAIRYFKNEGIKIGTTTGYTRKMMEVVLAEAKRQGYEPDALVCSDEVPRGRPLPFMCFENAKLLQLFPMESMVKIGDTPVDIEEGLNAGMWTIGLARTGNEFGLSEEEDQNLSDAARKLRLSSARASLAKAGAHFVVDGIDQTPAIMDMIQDALTRGARP